MIREPSKQETLMEMLVKQAKLDRVLHIYPRRIGGMIERLTPKEKEVIQLLKSNDLENFRGTSSY